MTSILGQILRCALEENVSVVPVAHRSTVLALMRCRTGELGHLVYACPDCGDVKSIPRSCGNRHCPQCQGRLARTWLERQQDDLLETPYFHVVCTLPHVLLPLCASAPRQLYALLFDAASQMLLRLGRERLGGQLGITMILHTWGQQLTLHPHVHCIVTGGALGPGGRWRRVKSRRYLFPVGVMSAVFRGKFLHGLTALRSQGKVPAPPGGWPKLWRQLGEADRWVVYCRPPFAGPASVLAYLGNYTHRVAISERRIERFDPVAGTGTFTYRDYADHGSKKTSTLPTRSFVGRFCQHLLPRSFTKIRHYGLLANHLRRDRIPLARAAIALTRVKPRRVCSPAPATTAPSQRSCPHCKTGEPICIALLHANGRLVMLSRTGPRLPHSIAPP